jgi:GMP synthase-like glutamine amidotransferase
MGVYDEPEYPWLAPEKLLIEQAIQAGKPVLGICLGAQLIAAVLGAEVTRNKHREIGWFPIEFSPAAVKHPILNGIASILTVFHWHGDRFAIPEGAIPLASSEACDNQGFLYNDRVLGLQFHLEMDDRSIAAMLDSGADNLTGSGFVQSAETIKTFQAGESTRSVLFKLLDNWLGLRGSA